MSAPADVASIASIADLASVADVVELHTWASKQSYSASTLEEELQAALPEPDKESAEAAARQVFEELGSRARLLPTAYPFTFDGATLAPNEMSKASSYLFCLGLSVFDDIDLNLRTREFETVVKEAAERYFGGKGIRIGAPWVTDEISSYEDLLQKV